MKATKILLTTLLIVILIVSVLGVFAHSGRTDSNGGHRDNNNVSGLGYYHYHCGGNPPHLHSNGYCPYKSGSSSSSLLKSLEDATGRKLGSSKTYNDGYDDGYDVGYNKGRNAGVSSTREVYEAKLEEQQTKYKNTVIAFSTAIGIMFAIFIGIIIAKRNK